MVSELAIEDIEQIHREGGIVHPRDVIRLNALGLKINKSQSCDLATMPRFALLDGVMFREPTIKQDMFLDECQRLFADDDATYMITQAFVLSHSSDEIDIDLMRSPDKLAETMKNWAVEKLGNTTMNQLERVINFCRYGCDQETNEFPVYLDLTNDRKDIENRSWALNDYLASAVLGIESEVALRATSPQLTQMIERAYALNGCQLKEEDKRLTADYYRTLDQIRKNAFMKEEPKEDTEVK